MQKLLIRDDGVVFTYTEALAADPRFRGYDGPIPCSHAEGRAWLAKLRDPRSAAVGEPSGEPKPDWIKDDLSA